VVTVAVGAITAVVGAPAGLVTVVVVAVVVIAVAATGWHSLVQLAWPAEERRRQLPQ
jgi:hypothetical protein